MTDLIIRPSVDADLSALHAIYSYSVMHESASWEYLPPMLEEFAARRNAILSQGYPYLTAEVDGLVAGFAYASSFRARIGYRHTVEDSVYVATKMAGRGIGKQLLDALVIECTTRGFRQMIAVIGDSANARSVRLHEACGFVHVSLLRSIGHKFGCWLDSVQMQRALGAGDSSPPERD